MTGPVDTNQAEPLDPQAYRHQWALLKSAHCARPVLHQGRRQFINGLSLYQDGGRVSMTVYLAGKRDGVDSSDVQIMTTSPETAEEKQDA
jgi:hypothetical protein